MLSLHNTTLSYGKATVLSGLNHCFSRRDFTCIIGKNGCGKSTLLRAAAGIAPYEGSITLDGAELGLLSRTERVKRLSYLPQTRPVPAMDVQTLIAHGRYPHLGFSKTLTDRDREQIARAAALTAVQPLLHRHLPTLSGGEQQRAYIAMMTAQDADLMILDEPTAHLDVEHQIQVMELLGSLHRGGKGVVMSCHDLPQAFHYATRIVLVAAGSIAAAGSPRELCESSALEAALGVGVKESTGADELYHYRVTRRDNRRE